MAWDDLHEPRTPDDRPPKGPGGPSGGGGGKPPFDIPQIQMPKFRPSMLFGIGLVILLAWIVPSVVYFVEPDEEGVVTTFGKFSRSSTPGMYFKFPSPIEHVRTPQVSIIRRAEIGIRTNRSGQQQRVPAESLMLTGDQNLVDVNLVVQYKINDAVAYLFKKYGSAPNFKPQVYFGPTYQDVDYKKAIKFAIANKLLIFTIDSLVYFFLILYIF